MKQYAHTDVVYCDLRVVNREILTKRNGETKRKPYKIILGECGALWGERERVVSCIYRQHGSYVYTACLQCIYAQCTIRYLYKFMHRQSG